jgi:hypothetical protein
MGLEKERLTCILHSIYPTLLYDEKTASPSPLLVSIQKKWVVPATRGFHMLQPDGLNYF